MHTLPIQRVVLMEDRAQVERRGTVALSGTTVVEVPGVSLAAVDRSLTVEVRGGTLVDSKLLRRWKEQPAGGLPADASELRRRVHALELERAAKEDAHALLRARAENLATARAALLRAVASHAAVGTPDVAAWREQLAAVTSQQADVDTALLDARQALGDVQAQLSMAQAVLDSAEQPPRALECALVLTLSGSGEASVRASYLVPCAAWRPAYRATLQGDTVAVEVEAVAWQRTGEAWDGVELQFSTARPTLGTAPPTLSEDLLTTRPKSAEERRHVDVVLREEAISTAGESGGTAELPGLDDGGEARLLSAPGPVTVRPDGQPHRVALSRFEAQATVEHLCPAELTRSAFVVARFANTSGQVLLAGPLDLVRASGLVGRTQLSFCAPGERVKLSFGVEDGVQVVRHVEEMQDESRLTGRRTTTRRVKLSVSNQRAAPLRLVLEERVPVSEVKEVEVQVLASACKPAPAPLTKDGIARLELQLPPGGRETASFAWELSAASKVTGA